MRTALTAFHCRDGRSTPNFLTCPLRPVNTVIAKRLLLWRSKTRPARAPPNMPASHKPGPERDGGDHHGAPGTAPRMSRRLPPPIPGRSATNEETAVRARSRCSWLVCPEPQGPNCINRRRFEQIFAGLDRSFPERRAVWPAVSGFGCLAAEDQALRDGLRLRRNHRTHVRLSSSGSHATLSAGGSWIGTLGPPATAETKSRYEAVIAERQPRSSRHATTRCCPGPRVLRRPEPVSSGRCDRG
jgi:hypothetical protein